MPDTFFVSNDGEELTHAQMTQKLMQRVTTLEALAHANEELLDNMMLRVITLENQFSNL